MKSSLLKSSLLKNSLFSVALWLAGGLGVRLSASDFPSMPSIDSPSMPSLSAPSSSPPSPWRGSAPYIPSQTSPAPQQPAEKSDSTDTKDTAAGLALTAQSISGLGGLEALKSLGGLGGLEGLSGLGGLNGLDALKSLEVLRGLEDEEDLKDYLSALSGSSGLDTEDLEAALEKLRDSADAADSSGTETADSEPAGSEPSSGDESEATAATLQQILRQLEILAAQRAAAQPDSSQAADTTQEPVQTENLSPSRILRFRANATDLLPTCTTVYFSQPDPAGAFLLTGDRLVKAGGKERNETFYFLFTPTLDADGSFVYTVEAQLMQDWTSERSELYPLTASLPLTATRTGNLVTLRHSSDSWNLDLLLDLREAHGE